MNINFSLDKFSNGVLIKKDGRLIHMVSIPPMNGSFIISLDKQFDFMFSGLIVMRVYVGSFLFYKGEVIDMKLKKR